MVDTNAKKYVYTHKKTASKLFSIELPQFYTLTHKDAKQKRWRYRLQHQHALLLASYIKLRTQQPPFLCRNIDILRYTH